MSEPKQLGDMTLTELLKIHGRSHIVESPSEEAKELLRQEKLMIAAELDKRCEAAGISLQFDRFIYNRVNSFSMDESEDIKWPQNLVVVDFPASEQHALESWLLQKHKA